MREVNGVEFANRAGGFFHIDTPNKVSFFLHDPRKVTPNSFENQCIGYIIKKNGEYDRYFVDID
jgi:hypothetical protein